MAVTARVEWWCGRGGGLGGVVAKFKPHRETLLSPSSYEMTCSHDVPLLLQASQRIIRQLALPSTLERWGQAGMG
jgi:hypothetical protein